MNESEILHVLVGHGLPNLFLNTLSSFRAVCPNAKLLVIDNASPQQSLRDELSRREALDPSMQLVLRDSNELTDPKVGALYQAYELAFDNARRDGYRYVHILQGDMQMLWWDDDARRQLSEIYGRHPECVNIYTCALSQDRTLTGDLVTDPASGEVTIRGYAITDTGLYDLQRWDATGLRFEGTEKQMAAKAAALGLKTIVSPCPTELQVPWPAVVRKGRQVGREVPLRKPFLCRPLSAEQIAAVKRADHPVTLEQVCVPWGWSCLAPMYVSDMTKWYYLNYRRHDLTRNGWRKGRPRWITAGLDHRYQLLTAPRRPGLIWLLLRPLPSLLADAIRMRRGRYDDGLSAAAGAAGAQVD